MRIRFDNPFEKKNTKKSNTTKFIQQKFHCYRHPQFGTSDCTRHEKAFSTALFFVGTRPNERLSFSVWHAILSSSEFENRTAMEQWPTHLLFVVSFLLLLLSVAFCAAILRWPISRIMLYLSIRNEQWPRNLRPFRPFFRDSFSPEINYWSGVCACAICHGFRW